MALSSTACSTLMTASDSLLCVQAYFLSDIVMYLLPFARHEWMFIVHHWFVSSYAVPLNFFG